MMINPRLLSMVEESKKYIGANVALQWCALGANVVLMGAVARLLAGLYLGDGSASLALTALVGVLALGVRWGCNVASARMSHLSARAVKGVLREKIYHKLLGLGASYAQQVKTSEVVQVAVEGVDQLEIYFGSYLPQFFYAMLAPITLFLVLSPVNLPSALVLLVCVPLIPASIAAVQTWAKKLLGKYWGEYTALGDTFLENLQGLTTLKIYQADGAKEEEMAEESERFRKITMKVLTMQLNSVTIMDLIAYGGAALGVIMAVTQYRGGHVSLAGAILIILLAAEFFIPMRLLGSFFHIAMNGMAASEKIFRLLDLPQEEGGKAPFPGDCTICCTHLAFGYQEERQVLQGVDLELPQGGFTALVGESGSGKSTLSALLMGRCKGYSGSITVGGVPLEEMDQDQLMANLTYVGHQSYIFKGTVRENLLLGNPQAGEEELWQVLEQVKLAPFLRQEGQGLDTPLREQGSNLSGGQRQRLALARALLHDSPIYIFDEATSNIDVESENEIMEQIRTLAREKTVLVISHRLANVVEADKIYVLERGRVAQQGTHQELVEGEGPYRRLWQAQQELEQYGLGGAAV